MNPERIWYGDPAPAVQAVRVFLWLPSQLYRLGWLGYMAVYKLGLKKAAKPHAPTVVVGNFTVGGSGKTPCTIAVAKILIELGYEVVIGTSGYGSEHEAGAAVAPAGEIRASEWGDESAVIRLNLPELPLIVGRDRVQAAQLCQKNFSNAVLLMDDGLQHLRLATDLKIALDPPNSNRMTLPGGPYREPPSKLRADITLPGVFELKRELSHFETPDGHVVDAPSGTQVQVLTAIAKPDRFLRALDALGHPVERVKLLNDHDPLTTGTLLASFSPHFPVVVTQKDWVKLRERDDLGSVSIWIACERATITPEPAFREWIAEKLRK